MKRFMVLLLLCFVSYHAHAALTYTGLTQIKSGRVIRNQATGALKFTVVSSGSDTLTSLIITSDANDFHTTNPAKITGIKLYFDDGDGVFDSGDSLISATTSDYTTAEVNTITFTLSETITTTQKTILVVFETGADIPITESMTIDITHDNNGAISVNQATIDIVGVDASFTDLSAISNLIYDKDATKFEMLRFQLTPDSEGYYLGNVIVSNNESNFDNSGSNHGIKGVYLYKETSGAGFSPSDDTLLKSITNVANDPVTFNATNSARFSFSASDGDNRKITTATTFYVVVDVGPSSNIEVNNVVTKLNAKISSLTGTGVNSEYAYAPLNIANTSNNNRTVSLAGMIIKSVQNILPSMNVAAGLTDIPILKFVAKSVGVTTRLKTLVIANSAGTFDSNSNKTGITNLSWIKDDSGGEYSGYGTDGPVNRDTKLADATFAINDNSKATFTYDNALVDIATGSSQTFYVLADFGTNMRSGQSVSLNISQDSRVKYSSTDMKVGTNLPLPVTPTQSITLVDPVLTVLTPFTELLFTDSSSANKKLVAGMYDIVVYGVTVNVAEQLTDITFEFESPNAYFSEANTGISRLSMYLDKNADGAISTADVFLSSTRTFLNSGRVAKIENISLPAGQNQKLLVVMELGQRLTTSNDQLSFRLKQVSVVGKVSAAMINNPVVPYTYDVVPHGIKVNNISTTISGSSNVISQASTFDVTVVVSPSSAGSIKLMGENSVPYAVPKFYLDGVGGRDRSYEFVTTFNANRSTGSPLATLLGGVDPAPSKTLVFNVNPSNITSAGNYLVDADIFYQMTDAVYLSKTSRLTRSRGIGADIKSAVDLNSVAGKTNITPAITSDNLVYSWTLPSYIASAKVTVNNRDIDFKNYQSIPQNASLKITFFNKGEPIDPDSIRVQLNGVDVAKESSIGAGSSNNYYTYNTLTGELIIQSIGTSSGQLVISANDRFGQAFPDAPLIFYTSAQLEINKLLIYPNPYSPSISPGITVGFSLTQSATVSFIIYDALGREVSRLPDRSYQMGYQSVFWTTVERSKYLGSGTYYLKMQARSNDGKTVVATTKLAVY